MVQSSCVDSNFLPSLPQTQNKFYKTTIPRNSFSRKPANLSKSLFFAKMAGFKNAKTNTKASRDFVLSRDPSEFRAREFRFHRLRTVRRDFRDLGLLFAVAGSASLFSREFRGGQKIEW